MKLDPETADVQSELHCEIKDHCLAFDVMCWRNAFIPRMFCSTCIQDEITRRGEMR